MSNLLFLDSLIFGVERSSSPSKKKTPDAIDHSTLFPGAMTIETPPPTPRNRPKQRAWYVPTPVPSVTKISPKPTKEEKNSPKAKSAKSNVDEKKTANDESFPIMKILVYYRSEEDKLRKRVVQAETKKGMSLDDAVKETLGYFGTLKRLKRTTGKLYQSSDNSYSQLEEINFAKHEKTPVSNFGPQLFFVFDTTGNVAKNIPVSMEDFPLWNI